MPAAATPLDPDESAGLLPGHIASREQLDEWEAENILEGQRWAAGAVKRRDLLDDAFLCELHRPARFHHRLVWIHPFPNGNGRHARLLTDLVLAANGAEPFTWGRGDLEHAGEARERYLAALRAADARDYSALLEFVRSD